MERGEPVLVPEWYRAANSGATGSANLNHSGRFLTQSDEHGVGSSSRNRLLFSAGDRDGPRSLAFANSSSSFLRGISSDNGSVSRDKDSSASSHPYSSFGRNRRDRGREKDRDLRVRDRSLVANGFHDRSDSFKAGSKDKVRRSQSIGPGRQTNLWPRGPGNNLKNGVLSGGSMASGISKSFERDFPSLRGEERLRIPDLVASPGLSPVAQSLPIGGSAASGGDVWTSALAKVPAIIVGNGSVLPSALQTPSTPTGLNMAEALAQAPSVRTPPQLSVDTHRIEELTLRQCKQLIPVTPSVPKTSNSSDKSKSKGARGDPSCPPKVGQQSSSQLVNHALRAPSRSDIPKTSQAGNFQVLNRERNGICPTAKDVPSVIRSANPLSAVASSAAIPPLKSPLSPKLKADNKGIALSSTPNYFGEKRPLCQAQNRNEFFNTLRKKTSMNHPSATGEPCRAASSSSSEKSDEQRSGTCAPVHQENSSFASNSGLECSIENGHAVPGGSGACESPERFLSGNGEDVSYPEPFVVPDEEEAAFLRLLGWEENGGEEALTAEEIDAFLKEYPSLKLTAVNGRSTRTAC